MGRNFDEIIRVIDALQLAAKFPIATPVGWTCGKDVMVQVRVPEEKGDAWHIRDLCFHWLTLSTILQPSCSDEAAVAAVGPFTKAELPSGKSYVRMVPDPSSRGAAGTS